MITTKTIAKMMTSVKNNAISVVLTDWLLLFVNDQVL